MNYKECFGSLTLFETTELLKPVIVIVAYIILYEYNGRREWIDIFAIMDFVVLNSGMLVLS
jgi:hypothetical protein